MQVEEFLLPDTVGEVKFTGMILADRRWFNNPEQVWRKRWTDMVLYRVVPGRQFKYIIHVVGRSAIYHQVGGPCRERAGKPWQRITVDELFRTDKARYQELVPCDRCTPEHLPATKEGETHLDGADDNVKIAIEADVPSVLTARTAADVPTRLYENAGKISLLAKFLLEDAMKVDVEIAEVMRTPRRID